MDVRTYTPDHHKAGPGFVMPAPGAFLRAMELEANGDPGFHQNVSTPIITRGMDPNDLSQRQALISRMAEGINRGADGGNVMEMLSQVGDAVQFLNRAISTTSPYLPIRENLEGEVAVLVPMDTPLRNRLTRHHGSGKASVWKQISSLGGGWSGIPQPGGGPGPIRSFFSETGAPAEHTTVYQEKSISYKLMGTMGSVTGFAAAQASNFSNQLAGEKTRAIKNLMLCEEYALMNGDKSSVLPPWGDGVNALAFDGIVNSISTANGTPTAQVQSAAGPLTLSLIDTMLRTMWDGGARNPWIMLSSQEQLSLTHLAQGANSIIRMQATTSDGGTLLGVKVIGYVHPVSSEIVQLIPTRWLPAGTMIFGSDQTPDGQPVMDIDVLPQVALPVLAPNTNVQGYTAQELAPTEAAPQVYKFIVTVYETFRLKAALYCAKISGLTAV